MNMGVNKLYILLVVLIFNIVSAQKQADLVVFSYDRPLQLYALLESVEHYITNLGQVTVIYRSSGQDFDGAYHQVQERFNKYDYLQQGANPRADFKPLTLQATFGSPNDYVLFAVDDIIVKDYVDLAECIEFLEDSGAYAFYLRLGRNLTECYPVNKPQKVPSLTAITSEISSWKFNQGQFDWNYPHTVDMTLYRKQDIKAEFYSLDYFSPNSLEGIWAMHWHKTTNRFGLCYGQSKIVNLPLNRVQNECQNRNTNFLSPHEMLGEFMQGKKIDIKPLFKIANQGAHIDYAPALIAR